MPWKPKVTTSVGGNLLALQVSLFGFLEAHNSEPRLVNKAGWVAAYCLGTRLSSQGLYYVADNLVPKAVLRERLGMGAALPFSQVPFTTSNPRTLTLCCKKACGKEAGSLQVSER